MAFLLMTLLLGSPTSSLRITLGDQAQQGGIAMAEAADAAKGDAKGKAIGMDEGLKLPTETPREGYCFGWSCGPVDASKGDAEDKVWYKPTQPDFAYPDMSSPPTSFPCKKVAEAVVSQLVSDKGKDGEMKGRNSRRRRRRIRMRRRR